jgi:hypothetical protein
MVNESSALNMTGCGTQHENQMAACRYFAQAALIRRGISASICRLARSAMELAGRRGRLIMAAAAALLALILALPGSAQAGFFDELFGQLFRPPVYQSYRAYPPRGATPGYRPRWHHFGHKAGRNVATHKRTIVVERPEKAVERQEPVDIMEDKSLRRGDAVMTVAGIRVFVGDSGDRHDPEDFRRPSEVRGLSKIERKALAALDTKGSASDLTGGIATGRSATDRKITAGEIITDAKGRTIRYVGP